MRVLQINTVCGTGSTGRIATDIDRMLKEKGQESYVAYGRNIAKNCDTSIKIGNIMDNYCHVALTRLFDMHGFGSKKYTKKFISEVKELNPDVIHLHNIHGYYINVELLFDYLKKAEKPVVWTLHDCWSFTGHCAYFDYVGCDKWKTGCNRCSEKSVYPASLFLDNSKSNYNRKKNIFSGVNDMTIITPSEWLAGLVRDSFLKEYKVHVINNGIDLSVFKHSKGSFRDRKGLEDKYIILGVANIWDRRKGLTYFHELSEKLHEDEVIVLVGLNDNQIKVLPDGIIGIKRTNNVRELVEIYSEADIFVNPTLEDNFPTTNIEALACGTPIMTFNTGGSIECIDCETGIIVEKNNCEEIRKEIDNVKTGKYIFKKERLVEKVVSKYNKEDRFKEYINLYEHKCGC